MKFYQDITMRLASQVFQNALVFLLTLILLVSSNVSALNPADEIRRYTRSIEFDYVSWTVDALLLKLGQASLAVPHYLTEDEQHTVVIDYLKLVQDIDSTEHQIELIYADPTITDKDSQLKPWQDQLAKLNAQRDLLGPTAEEIFQKQVSDVLDEFGLGTIGQPLPPVLFHTTPLPYALIISPRNVIREDQNISLDPNLTLDQMVALEKQVESALNVSALVTPIGGIGSYPTMVMSTSNLPWRGEVVFRTNGRTITCSSARWIKLFCQRTTTDDERDYCQYRRRRDQPGTDPAFLSRIHAETTAYSCTTQPGAVYALPYTPEPETFNFNKEMRITRVTVDQMLQDGKIDEAEAYMENSPAGFCGTRLSDPQAEPGVFCLLWRLCRYSGWGSRGRPGGTGGGGTAQPEQIAGRFPGENFSDEFVCAASGRAGFLKNTIRQGVKAYPLPY